MGVILTASSDFMETGLQNQELPMLAETSITLYALPNGLQIFQTRLQVRPSCHWLNDDRECLCGFFDFGQQELAKLGCIDGNWSVSYTFDVNEY